jgi:LacI family transcriptional regulator
VGRQRHRVTDIAAQAALSRATVDRVLHGREGVRPETRAQVERALAELDRQRDQVELSTRPLLLDLVMQAPERFASASRRALEAELRSLRPALLRARSHLAEESDARAAASVLDDVRRRGSDGVVLKAPDDPDVAAAVDGLVRAGIPVVTFVTDVPGSRRAAYVGVDNEAAGATAAYLVVQWAGPTGAVLVTLSSSSFRGEVGRSAGFRATLQELAPDRRVVEVAETDGLDSTMLEAARSALREDPRIDSVYSAGGGNQAILAAFAEAGRPPRAFVAHDLDGDNRRLLRSRRVSAVLHHDLRGDMRRACRLLLQARGVLPGTPTTRMSQIQVVTPYNEPAELPAGDS